MKPDQFKKRHQAPRVDDRVRRQIAVEAARRMLDVLGPGPDDPPAEPDRIRLRDVGEAAYYSAKRKAAAVLGHPVRPGDLPSDHEVREAALEILRDLAGRPAPASIEAVGGDESGEVGAEPTMRMADHLDRFQLYAMRLRPLESVKQNPRQHPEGDALFHSLQVFELARAARPYDEEFLLAALLHDVGKAIEPTDHASAGVEALRGAVTDRTLLLVEHHMALAQSRPGDAPPVDDPDLLEDLDLLRRCNEGGRIPGAEVGTVEQALAYLRRLDEEDYLDEPR